jgi:hypothetical protein
LHDSASHLPWPAPVTDFIRRETMGWSMWELQHRQALVGALEALAAQDIEPLLFKGTALAYGAYAEPYTRLRADSDLLVEPHQRKRAARALESVGFDRKGSVSGEYVSYEASFTRQVSGFVHQLDLHWRIHYSQFQSTRLSYAFLREQARPLPRLSLHALAPSPAHAVLLNCVHRANDLNVPQWQSDQPVFAAQRLVSRYDLHLLLEGMTPGELDDLISTAHRLGVASICREPILAAVANFGTRAPESFVEAWRVDSAPDSFAEYHAASAPAQRWSDFVSIRGVWAKAAFLGEHIAPPADYMQERFPDLQGRRWWLRGRRLLHGLRRWRQSP